MKQLWVEIKRSGMNFIVAMFGGEVVETNCLTKPEAYDTLAILAQVECTSGNKNFEVR